MLALLAAIAPENQVWGKTEDTAVIVLLAVGVLLTLLLAGIFTYVLTRRK